MKNLFFGLLVLLSLSTHAAITVVSDLDDTIKITNSSREIDGTINALFSNDVFTGMPELLLGMRTYADEFHVLSASPSVLRPKILSTFKKKQINVDSLILKGLFDRDDKLVYKVKELKKLIEKNS